MSGSAQVNQPPSAHANDNIIHTIINHIFTFKLIWFKPPYFNNDIRYNILYDSLSTDEKKINK